MKVAISGHRPDRIGGYAPNPKLQYVIDEMYRVIDYMNRNYEGLELILGMALGTDQLAAEICLVLDIPFTAAVPFPSQEERWPESAQRTYREMLTLARHVEYVCPQYSKAAFMMRNNWMLRQADRLLAVWCGEGKTGTGQAVRYARSIHMDVHIINPDKYKNKR